MIISNCLLATDLMITALAAM